MKRALGFEATTADEETLDFAALKCYNAKKWINKEVDYDANEFP